MRDLRILQIFSRYQHYGGEEGSVYRIGDALQEDFEIEYFVKSTKNLLAGSPLEKALVPWRVLHNSETTRQLRRLQEIGRFDLWLVHNVFPALSPSVYQEAFRQNVPMVHYLHNYRFFCVNGFFLNHGSPCQLCAGGNSLHSLKEACWHDSHLVSGWMGLVLHRIRMMGVFERVARWVAISHAQKEVHVSLGIPADRIDVIYHFFEPKSDPLPLPKDGYALFLGRVSAEKGVMDLLKAWRCLPPERQLVIAGEGPELPHLQAFAAEAGLENVRFTGFVPKEQQDELWAGAAFLAVPSIWMEPFGMVVLEAWARGRSVVAYANGALTELISHNNTGVLTPPNEPEQLGAAMEALFRDPDRLRAMAIAGRAEVETRFSKAEWMRQIRETLNRAAGRVES